MAIREYNFDGLVGPTHNYAGLSFGNVASSVHRNQVAHPKAAALQGLQKMKTLAELGIGQGVLPPVLRPDTVMLGRLGIPGISPEDRIQNAARMAPELLANCYSAASMWAANAATVSPSPDTSDGRLHLTPANLSSTLHRSLEPAGTTELLRTIFADDSEFKVHDPLPAGVALSDEGAANQTRFCDHQASPGIELFVYGADLLNPNAIRPTRFPARQTRLACEAIARCHRLSPANTIVWQQSPAAIDAGVFHNDVISVGNQQVLLVHELAFVDQAEKLSELRQLFRRNYDSEMFIIEFSQAEFPLADVVQSYLFNSQLVTRPDGGMTLICPTDCQQIATATKAVQRILEEENPIDDVRFLDLRQSMNNGGGPACLRLRVPLSASQVARVHPGVLLTDSLFDELQACVNEFYRDSLHPQDLQDPGLITEAWSAVARLYQILQLPPPAFGSPLSLPTPLV